MSNFKEQYTLEHRLNESKRIREKYPERFPVIVEKGKGKNSANIKDIDKKKYLVTPDLTVGQFIYVIRKRIGLKPENAIFIFVNNILPPSSKLMSDLYREFKDEDGYLYVTYTGEETFGFL